MPVNVTMAGMMVCMHIAGEEVSGLNGAESQRADPGRTQDGTA
jgi:hypothetical protein